MIKRKLMAMIMTLTVFSTVFIGCTGSKIVNSDKDTEVTTEEKDNDKDDEKDDDKDNDDEKDKEDDKDKVDNDKDDDKEPDKEETEDKTVEETEEETTEEEQIEETEEELVEETEEETTEEKQKEYEVIQRGCSYITAAGEELTPGDVMPLEPEVDDIYFEGDYAYQYEEIDLDSGETLTGWNVLVTNTTLEEYDGILDEVLGIPIIFMAGTFNDCYRLKKSPEIPETVVFMYATFSGCSTLEVAPEIPQSVLYMPGVFYECYSLKESPEIPQNVISLYYTFVNCDFTSAPKIPESVIEMEGTFMFCDKLEYAPKIPKNVNNMNYTFAGCIKLSGEVEIDANPDKYVGCFANVDFIEQDLTIVGKTSLIKELRETRKDEYPS